MYPHHRHPPPPPTQSLSTIFHYLYCGLKEDGVFDSKSDDFLVIKNGLKASLQPYTGWKTEGRLYRRDRR